MTVSDVTFIGDATAGRAARIDILTAQKFTVSDFGPARVAVIDGSDAALADSIAEARGTGAAILVIFKLPHGVSFRARRATLLSAGVHDVMLESAPEEEFLRRVRALILLSRPARIMVLEDEDEIGDWVEKELRKDEKEIVRARTIAEARTCFESDPIDAMVVDRKLPDGDGADLVEHLRELGIRTPALFLSAFNTEEDQTRGMEQAGGNDYLGKGVEADVLRMRVRVALRPWVTDDVLIFGPLELNRKDRIVRWRGELIEMKPKDKAMLIYLAERADLPIPQSMIYLDVWQNLYSDIESRRVAQAKFRLTRDLKAFLKERGEAYPDFLGTVGDAYVFRTEPLLRLPETGQPVAT